MAAEEIGFGCGEINTPGIGSRITCGIVRHGGGNGSAGCTMTRFGPHPVSKSAAADSVKIGSVLIGRIGNVLCQLFGLGAGSDCSGGCLLLRFDHGGDLRPRSITFGQRLAFAVPEPAREAQERDAGRLQGIAAGKFQSGPSGLTEPAQRA